MRDIEEWVRDQLNSGYSRKQIIQSLLDSGYSTEEAISVIKKVTSQKEEAKKKIDKKQISYLIIIFVVASFSFYYFVLYPYLPQLPGETKTSVNITRDLHSEVNPGSNMGVLIKASFEEPTDLEIYEKMPEGFEIIGPISSHMPEELENNLYFFNITKKPDTYGIAITYFVSVPEDASGSYQIQGWYKLDGQKINIEPSNFKVL